MSPARRLARLTAIVALAATLPALAQYPLEIIALRHRTVDQVLPALQPLLEPGATLSGQSGQLFVRTSPANLAEIRRALDALDLPARRLQILVRVEGDAEAASRDLSGSGVISNRGSRIELRAGDARSGETERIDQRIQVVEGGTAWISTGQSRTLPQRQLIRTPGGMVSQETFVVQEASSGFAVQPRLSGDFVTLDILQQREGLAAGGTLQSQRAVSTASGRLGEWFELGALAGGAAGDERRIGASSQRRAADSRRVWVKVQELRN